MNTSSLIKAFQGLHFEDKIIAAILLTDIILPAYTYFYKFSKWGDPDFLQSMLYKAESHVDIYATTVVFTDNELKRVMELIPNSDNFSTFWSSYAQNAAIAVSYIVMGNINQDDKYLNYVIFHFYELLESIVADKYYHFGISAPELTKSIHEDSIVAEWNIIVNNIIFQVNSKNNPIFHNLDNLKASTASFPFYLIDQDR